MISEASVALTETAARRIREVMASEVSGSKLRVSVDGGGCSGFQYIFGIEPGGNADDIRIERDGATVLIDPVSLELLAGSTIDFVDDLVGQSFRITNPNASSSCGCGTSFSI
ncbi:MAG: iron-sulfur cluster insertion protein ErpA [Bosea sp. (in: a-proteobacteria)]